MQDMGQEQARILGVIYCTRIKPLCHAFRKDGLGEGVCTSTVHLNSCERYDFGAFFHFE